MISQLEYLNYKHYIIAYYRYIMIDKFSFERKTSFYDVFYSFYRQNFLESHLSLMFYKTENISYNDSAALNVDYLYQRYINIG